MKLNGQIDTEIVIFDVVNCIEFSCTQLWKAVLKMSKTYDKKSCGFVIIFKFSKISNQYVTNSMN